MQLPSVETMHIVGGFLGALGLSRLTALPGADNVPPLFGGAEHQVTVRNHTRMLINKHLKTRFGV